MAHFINVNYATLEYSNGLYKFVGSTSSYLSPDIHVHLNQQFSFYLGQQMLYVSMSFAYASPKAYLSTV